MNVKNDKGITLYGPTPDQASIAVLQSIYPGAVRSGIELNGSEAVVIYNKEEDFQQGVVMSPYAHHVLALDNKYEATIDEGVRLARAGISAVIQQGDMNELISTVGECYREKKNIGFYLSTDESLKPKVSLNPSGLLQVEGFKNNYLVGKSAPMERLVTELANATYFDGADILVLGENGTGKELVSKTLIENSHRSKNAVVLNVGSMSDELFKSELMGYKKGAFTGADRDTEGYLQRYNKGLIVFDEIGDLSLRNQATLLRVIQERQAVRLGPGETPYNFDIQFVFATNKPVEQMVKKGEFRLDLFNRLKKQMIIIPPLRERKEDIELLTAHFVGFMNTKYKERQKSVAKEATELMKELPFPGNVRELEHLLFRCYKSAKTSVITAETVLSAVLDERYSPTMKVKANHEVIQEAVTRIGMKF